MSAAPFASLVVNKRKLPTILQNEVSPLRIAGTAVESLVMTPRRLWGVLHSTVGKQIQHSGQTITILSVHQNTRLVVPFDEGEHKVFWIPRRPTNRKQFNLERVWRSRRYRTLRAPVWTGESRPPIEQNASVELSDFRNTLTHEDVIEISKLGFPLSAMVPQTCTPFRSEHRRKTRRELGEVVIVKTPFSQMRPEQREQRDDHQRLMQILGEMSRMSPQRASSLYDVIVLGKSSKEVAEARGMNAASLAVTVSRVRAKMS
jgi:hypothetical protein